MSRGSWLLSPEGALLRFPWHPAQSATLETEPRGKPSSCCCHAFLFFKLPPYGSISHQPLCISVAVASFRNQVEEPGERSDRGLQEGKGHLAQLTPTSIVAAWARGHPLPASMVWPQTPWLLGLIKGKLRNMVLAHHSLFLRASSPSSPDRRGSILES